MTGNVLGFGFGCRCVGTALSCHCEQSEAILLVRRCSRRLPRRYAPRNDEAFPLFMASRISSSDNFIAFDIIHLKKLKPCQVCIKSYRTKLSATTTNEYVLKNL